MARKPVHRAPSEVSWGKVCAIIAIVAGLWTVGILLSIPAHAESVSTNAHSYRILPPNHHVKERHMRYFEPVDNGDAFVILNNGAAWHLAPCAMEDSERCWWDALNQGNGRGESFVRVGHKTYYLDGGDTRD